MSSATVFLFLLDNLPDFKNALNSTLVTLHEARDITLEISNVDNCNPIIAQSLLNEIKNEIEKENLSDAASEEETTVILHPNDYEEAFNELSTETLYNMETVFHKTTEKNNIDAVVTECTGNDIATQTTSVVTNDSKGNGHEIITDKVNASDTTNNTIVKNINSLSKQFPEKAPFLVALFETCLNVTAQTCGGTLVSSHWVLVTVSCLGWLSNLYVDSVKKENLNNSDYTVILGATNPFKDGSLHHVTEIMFMPEDDGVKGSNLSDVKTWNQTNRLNEHNKKLNVVLMRIEPAASVAFLPIFTSKLKDVEDVQVYGWSVVNNETGSEVMDVASFSAKTLPSEECRANLSQPNPDSILCLTVESDINSKINQMYYGGPVLVQHDDKVSLLAVAQFEGIARGAVMYAYSLATHTAWIDTIVVNKN